MQAVEIVEVAPRDGFQAVRPFIPTEAKVTLTVVASGLSYLQEHLPAVGAGLVATGAADLIGYGRTPPDPRWPGGAHVAVQFVINYEEGGENSILHGDPAAEAFLSEIIGAQPIAGMRHMNMESLYEYGSRAGVWRLLDLFKSRGVPLTKPCGRVSQSWGAAAPSSRARSSSASAAAPAPVAAGLRIRSPECSNWNASAGSARARD